MEHYEKDTNNNNPDKKPATRSEMNRKFITTIALPALLLLLTLISAAPTYPVQATTVGSNETAATPAPGGASVGPAGGGTNVTQSACLPQNATTTTGRPAIDAGGANYTTATVAPGGASIGANDTSTLNATAGNTTTTNNITATVAPGGASIC